MRIALILFVLLAGPASATPASPPVTVDGEFDDWDPQHIVAVDPAGDATGAFDLRTLMAQSRGSMVYLRFDTGRVLNIQAGPGDEGTLVFRFEAPAGEQALEIDARARSVRVVEQGGARTEIGWHGADYRTAPTYASDEFELQVDLSVLGMQTGDELLLSVSGSDSLDKPVLLTLGPAGDEPSQHPLTLDRPEHTLLRAASLNTFRNGIVDPERSEPLLRLLKVSQPDVVLLQEEYNTSAEDVRKALDRALGESWNIVKVRDNAIATRLPLTKLQSLDDSYAAAIVETPTQGPVLVFSIHPKCCGTIGSEEDRRRIHQTQAMIQTIDLARSRFGDSLPVLLAGDWNLVGSRSPLDLLTDPAGAALRRVDLRHIGSRETYTWLDPASAFAPGVLDLAAVDAPSWDRSRGFLLDTRTILPESLDEHGLRAPDSAASDHLLMIVDLAVAPPAAP